MLRSSLALVFSLACLSNANAALLATYEFIGSSAASADTDANSAASAFADGDGVLTVAGSVGNPAPSAYKTYTEVATSFGGTSYFTFNISPNIGFDLDLTSLVFQGQKDQIQGNPTVTFDLRTDAGGDNYATSLGAFSLTNNNSNFTADLTSSLLAAQFQNVTSTVSFRIYVFDGGQSSTDLGVHIDNIDLNGTSAAIVSSVTPEPMTLAFWSLGAVGLGMFRFKRRKISH